jgi:peptidoglycan/xylan/chitin deacetylase (PgdA/CDA1 family)
MINIVIPSNNIEERKYLLKTVFNDFLKIEYTIHLSDTEIKEYRISIQENNDAKEIIIKDYFFSLYPDTLEYLQPSAIPKNVTSASHPLFIEKTLPLLFGKDKIEINQKRVLSHIDIFATIFFMLTRWEEYVILERDEHNRFPHEASLAHQYNFLHRPIVNECVEFLWNILKEAGYHQKRIERESSILLTHDIDEVQRYPSPIKLLKGMAGDVIYRKSPLLPLKTLYRYINIKREREKDPYDTFEEIMDISDEFNLKSHFFFMSGGTTTKYDNRYDIKEPSVRKTIENIKKRGHIIGIHPSYNAYNNEQQFKLEKEILEEVNQTNIVCGREHYLRFEIPTTWQLWENNGLKWCSNLAYPKKSGFRTGSCYPFHPFNILSRRTLTITEHPLIMMEATFIEEGKSPEKVREMIDYYLHSVEKYKGEFVLLWHNASFNQHSLKAYSPIYKETIQKHKKLSL